MAENARERLEDILNQREYQVYEEEESQGMVESFFNRIEEWINEQLANLLSTFGMTEGGVTFGFIIIIIIVIALLAGILFYIFKRSRRQRLAKNEKPFNIDREKDWSYQDHLNESVKFEQEANFTLASRHLFLALLLHFHEIGWLEAKSWKTNWEYYDELRKSNKKSADFFYQFVQLFDHITYGKREVQQEEYDNYRKEAMQWITEKSSDHDGRMEG